MKQGKASLEFQHMIGCLYDYRGHTLLVKEVLQDGEERYKVVTDARVIKETKNGMRSEFTLLQTPEEISESKAVMLSVVKQDTDLNKVSAALMKTIEEVQADPGKLAQAQAVCEIAQSVVNVGRLQFDVLKMAHTIRRERLGGAD